MRFFYRRTYEKETTLSMLSITIGLSCGHLDVVAPDAGCTTVEQTDFVFMILGEHRKHDQCFVLCAQCRTLVSAQRCQLLQPVMLSTRCVIS